MKARTVPAGDEGLLRRAVLEVAQTGTGVTVTGLDEQAVAVILPPDTHRAQAVINQEDEPATHLAIAEDERHTLLAQAARDHLSRAESENRRYAAEIEHIESVFRDRIASYDQVPEWITAARKADISQALRLVDAASAADTARLIARAGLHDLHVTALRRLLAGAEPAKVYPAWVAADKILRAARR
jgi:hypothetical protein